jgi:hypothetical protein
MANTEVVKKVVFDGYRNVEISINPDAYNAIKSFFLKEIGDKDAAEAMAQSLMAISADTNIDPMKLLDEISSQEGVSVNALMAALINRTRSNTSLLGIKEPKKPTNFVARNIIQ